MISKNPVNILFLLIDSLRADLCFGKDRRVKTPTIDALIQKGTSFTQAISTTSTTSPSVATIMTGMYPFAHGVRSLKGYKLNPECITLAEILKKNGYWTCGMVTGPLSQEIGLYKGFDEYIHREQNHNLYTGFAEELIHYLKGLSQKEPWFLFVHFFELHGSIRPLVEKCSLWRDGKNFYEQALSYLDSQLKKVLEVVNLDTTLVILHADHGEREPNFLFNWLSKYRKAQKLYRKLTKIWMRQKGSLLPFLQIGHGYHVYDYLVRVPLILAGGKIPPAKIITKQVGQIDLFPTIIDLVGIDQKNITHGRSLCPLINEGDIEEQPLYMEACGVVIPNEENWLVGIRIPEWKFVFAPKNKKRQPELYNLKNDPKELKNLINKRMEIAQMLEKELLKVQSINLEELKLTGVKMFNKEEKEMEKRLRGLGYL